jgi:DNA-binding NarL/FixJ family response regulator
MASHPGARFPGQVSARVAYRDDHEGDPRRGLRAVAPGESSRSSVRVCVVASDPLVRAGLVSELRDRRGIHLLDGRASRAEVVVAVLDTSGTVPELIGEVSAGTRLVVVADQLRPAELLAAVERGLVVLVPRQEATAARLVRAITDARRGRGDLPAEELGELLRRVTQLQREVLAPRGLTLSGLSLREADVLRLLADGMDTAEIAERLSYSERTVKNILHGALTRLGLRNRTHAVAHALRHGLI